MWPLRGLQFFQEYPTAAAWVFHRLQCGDLLQHGATAPLPAPALTLVFPLPFITLFVPSFSLHIEFSTPFKIRFHRGNTCFPHRPALSSGNHSVQQQAAPGLYPQRLPLLASPATNTLPWTPRTDAINHLYWNAANYYFSGSINQVENVCNCSS